jgi:hypothetical protein
VETVLHTPSRALVEETKAVSTPGMTYEVVERTEAIKGATELTAEQGMKTRSSGGR